MKKPEEVLIAEEGFELRLRPRSSTPVTIRIPDETISSLQKIAATRDMSIEALIKLYVGQGLRQDQAKQFGDRLLEKMAEVLGRHIQSEEEVTAILKEIRTEAIT